ncbi:SAF domain-containing protein [Branchiibius hedensis]|uniref:SAF domain-containing protein n=1 Tax=Branchiibius hedensis TaxID=672460 RepID=A0A2Y8ZUL6_9MICO|nr:SAF domain-containing protein [Branchiibius hedensis]PWJ26384.1 SAF domain-containing protein [Branchiibius hedensis]SSA35196.1 SAF domain-containing protein [Branchiibius hedensis]
MKPPVQRLLPDSWQGGSVAATARRHRARKVLAAVLVAVAALAAVHRVTSAGATRTVVVAAHDLSAGQRLAGADLRSVAWPVSAALPDPLTMTQAVGAVVDAPMRAGEPVTAARIRDARSWAGSSSRVVLSVPVEPALAAVLQRGDRVDVYAGARLVAATTTVVQTSAAAASSWTESEDPRVLLSVSASDAAAVAAGGEDSGSGRLTLALHPAA